MEEMETPTEQAMEDMHHHATHSSERWISMAALSSALLAALAAVTVLLAGTHANEAMLTQAKGNDKWTQFQAKSIKALILQSKIDGQKWGQLRTLSEEDAKEFKASQAEDAKKSKEYTSEKTEIQTEATELIAESTHHMGVHEIYARGVTMFQVAIAVAAISVLSKRSQLWYVGLAFGCIGIFFLVRGMLA